MAQQKLKSVFTKAKLKVQSDPQLMAEIGELLVSSIQLSIEQGGRYKRAGSFDGGPKKFEKLTPFSSAFKKAKGKNPSNILRESGRLRNSITYEVRGKELLVGSNVVYAAIHQFGGKIRITKKSRAFFRYKAAEAEEEVERDFWQGLGASKNGFLMPARPFVTVQQIDIDDIGEIIADALKGELV